MDNKVSEQSPIDLAQLSLNGLSVGDSFGENFFWDAEKVKKCIEAKAVPNPPWYLTDDSVMAIGILEILEKYGAINQDELAKTFAKNYRKNPFRGYGSMAHEILQDISCGKNWREVSAAAFNGKGSFGNGASMRVGPVGAFFSSDMSNAVTQARLSAEITHAHPEGQAGAIAVAAACASVCAAKKTLKSINRKEILELTIDFTPDSQTRNGLITASTLAFASPITEAVKLLGNGSRVSAPDTVPFCIWCACRHIDNYEEALWQTVSALGDRDTTCAIVGSIVVLATGIKGIPTKWLSNRESLTEWQKMDRIL